MLFNVPQYIDVEDKVAGPLTFKQIGWMGAMGAILLFLWAILSKIAFFISAVPIVIIFGALAFYRPHKQPLSSFVASGIFFIFNPKTYVWKRSYTKPKQVFLRKSKKHKKIIKKKEITADQIQELAKVMDSEGKIDKNKI